MKPRLFLPVLLSFLLTASASAAPAKQKPTEKPKQVFYTVKRVVDGDTVVLSTGEKVRMIGIDTPESRMNKKLKRDMEKTRLDADTIIALGKRSAQFTRTLTEGKPVRLEFDVQKKDRYDRLLAYLYAENGTFVNAEIIKEGYAMVMTVPPNVKYKDLFAKYQKEAREAQRGLWRTTPIKTR